MTTYDTNYIYNYGMLSSHVSFCFKNTRNTQIKRRIAPELKNTFFKFFFYYKLDSSLSYHEETKSRKSRKITSNIAC